MEEAPAVVFPSILPISVPEQYVHCSEFLAFGFLGACSKCVLVVEVTATSTGAGPDFATT